MNQNIFNSFPVLETSNLILRKIEPKDAKDLFSFLTDPAVSQYMTNAPYENIVQVQRSINGMQQFFESKQKIRWGIAKKADDKIIGHCGYFSFDEINLIGEINYCLSRENWGQGIMTEAIMEIVRFGFEKINLNRVEAKTIPENIASLQVLEKAGFRQEGLLREGLLKNGIFHNLYIYSILKKDI